MVGSNWCNLIDNTPEEKIEKG
jgi:DNA-directed RNA polymerase II subunit RPB2